MPRITVTPPGAQPQAYKFDLIRESVSIGRGSENDVLIDCASISINHAVMERIPTGYWVRDLGSTNSTKFEGKAYKRIKLEDKMVLKLGDVKFEFTLTPEEIESLAGEETDEDQEDILKDNAPVAKDYPAQQTPVPAEALKSSKRGLSFPLTVLLMLVAFGAFFVGMSIRYTKDNPGRSMLKDIMNGKPAEVQAVSADDKEAE